MKHKLPVIICIVIVVVSAAQAQNISFNAAQSFPTGLFPQQVVKGDFNGDGILDFVTTNHDGLSICLGHGDGTFGPPAYFSAGFYVEGGAAAVADFNGDGKLDLAVMSGGGPKPGSLSILLGNGDGTFQAPTVMPNVGFGNIAVGDFNGDGKADLALNLEPVVSGGAAVVEILFGNGNGGFAAPLTLAQSTLYFYFLTGDFNRDGITDVALMEVAQTSGGTLTAYLGQANGTFIEKQTSFTVTAAYPIVGDFNGDGRLDVVATTSTGTAAFLGKGDGTFRVTTADNSGLANLVLSATLDANHDGKADLVATNNQNFPIALTVALSNGDGTFRVTDSFPEAAGCGTHVLPGYFNKDGNEDFLTPGCPALATVYLGDGKGGFRHSSPMNEPTPSVVLADVNGDGRLDLVTTHNVSGPNRATVQVQYGNGDGTFASTPQDIPVGTYPTRVAVADVNGDGIPDLISPQGAVKQGYVVVNLGTGGGSFGPQVSSGFGLGLSSEAMVLGDLNGDGLPDLVVAIYGRDTSASGGIDVLLNLGGGSFATPVSYGAGNHPVGLALGDLDGDGNLDLVVAAVGDNKQGVTTVFYGNGDGTFGARQTLIGDYSPSGVAIGDLNGDGKPDLVVAYQGLFYSYFKPYGSLEVFLNSGGRAWAAPVGYDAGLAPWSVTLADFNHDGKLDAAVMSPENAVTFLTGNGDGTFALTGTSYGLNYYNQGMANSGSFPIVTGDLNGDGLPDVVVGNGEDVTVLLNTTKVN